MCIAFFRQLIILGTLSCFLGSPLLAQDPIFNQYYHYKLYLNPAFTGFDPGINLHTGLRSQWHKVADNNGQFLSKYMGLSAELPKLRVGIGFYYLDNLEGEGGVNWPAITPAPGGGLLRLRRYAFSFAWHNWPCRMDKRFNFALGMSGGFNRYTQDWAGLVFSDQLDAIRGKVRDTKLDLPSNLQQSNFFYHLSAGGLMQWQTRHRLLRTGLAVHNITPQNSSILGGNAPLPLRFTFHSTAILDDVFGSTRRGLMQLIPLVKVDIQRAARAQNAFSHQSVQIGSVIKAGTENRFHTGLFIHTNRLLSTDFDPFQVVNQTNRNIQSLVISFGYDHVAGGGGGNNVPSVWGFTASWSHDFLGATGLGDIFEFGLQFGLPPVSLLGQGCGSCPANKLDRRF
ncbi:MAG: type IX secretion system membrane protein PorP/SprF [Bacteroidota bacterium]